MIDLVDVSKVIPRHTHKLKFVLCNEFYVYICVKILLMKVEFLFCKSQKRTEWELLTKAVIFKIAFLQWNSIQKKATKFDRNKSKRDTLFWHEIIKCAIVSCCFTWADNGKNGCCVHKLCIRWGSVFSCSVFNHMIHYRWNQLYYLSYLLVDKTGKNVHHAEPGLEYACLEN